MQPACSGSEEELHELAEEIRRDTNRTFVDQAFLVLYDRASAAPVRVREKLPGIKAVHAIITPTCRKNRTPIGAIQEAYERVMREYMACIAVTENAQANYHLAFTVERALADERERNARRWPNSSPNAVKE